MTKPLFKKIDELVDELIAGADDESILSSNIPARKMLKLFMTLKTPFKRRILAKFTQDKHDPLAKKIRALFAQPDKLPYFQSMISLSYFYWNWAAQFKSDLRQAEIDDLTLSLIYGAIGYKLLDTYCDEQVTKDSSQSAQLLYIAKYLIAVQETVLASNFRDQKLYTQLAEKYNRAYCNAGIAEQVSKFKASPLSQKEIIKLGHKSAPLFLYFALILERAAKRKAIPDYELMFYLTTASIQIHDDIFDALEDMQNGSITLVSDPFVKSVDFNKLVQQPKQLEKKFAEYLQKSKNDVKLLTLANLNLEKALAASRKYQDDIFELFILSKQLSVLEKINRKEAKHAKSKRQESKKNNRR